MDCLFFRGNLSTQDREFLLKLLKSYDARLMLDSWVGLGQIKIPSGTKVDSDKARAVEILRRKGFCVKEHVDVYALDQGCAFHRAIRNR